MKKTIKKVYKISATVDQVWQALVDQKVIDEWEVDQVRWIPMQEQTLSCGMEISTGKISKLYLKVSLSRNGLVVTGRNLLQSLLLSKKDNSDTILELEQIDVPDEEFEDIKSGWDDYYMGPMKQMLEKKH